MPNTKYLEPLLDRKSAAKYLNVSPGTLAVWDCTKRYDLKQLKVGRTVRYRRSDLDRFLEEKNETVIELLASAYFVRIRLLRQQPSIPQSHISI